MCPITNPEQMNRKPIFDLLSSSIRRKLIVTLHDSGSVERKCLSKTLTMADDTENAHHRIHTALHHNHLPRLSEAGLVDYDDERVTPTSRLEAVANKIPYFDEGDQAPVRA